MSDAPDPGDTTYVESQVIMTTVRVVAPFSFTYGLFLLFHGADSPGGSFQGGAIIGATILMLAFAFGIEPTRNWLRNRTVVLLATGGVAVFALIGLIPIGFGGRFLEYPVYETELGIDAKWPLEAVEIGGIAPIVAAVVIGLFFVLAAGFLAEDTASVAPGSATDGEAPPSEPEEVAGDD